MRNRLLPLSLLALGAPAAAFAAQQSVSLTASQDTTIFEPSPEGDCNGSGIRAIFGTTLTNNTRHYLVQFDVAGAVPAGATVTNARLTISVLSVSGQSTFNYTQHVHRLTSAWGEGASDAGIPGGRPAPAQPGDATWTHTFFPGSNWTNPGGDFVSLPSGVFQNNGFGPQHFSSAGMVADVQDWLDQPTTNHGWLLRESLGTPGSAILFSSREDPFVQSVPSLLIEYTTGGGLSTFCDPAANNSTGLPTVLTGAMSAPGGSGLHLEAAQGPPGQFGYFLVGTAPQDPGAAVGSGFLCLSLTGGNLVGRYNVGGGNLNSIGLFDGSGILQNGVGTSSVGSGFDVPSALPLPGSPSIQSGETWHFQLWHREDGGDSNLSNGLSVTF